MQKKTFTFASIARFLTLLITLMPLFSQAQCLPTQPTLTINTPVCVGGGLTLTSSTAAGVLYFFSGPSGYFFSSSTPNATLSGVTAANAGDYSVAIFNPGCAIGQQFSTQSAAHNVVVNGSFTVTATATPNPVCLGGTLNLSAPLIAGATYAWTGPNGFTSALQNPVISGVTAAAAGVYNLTVNVSGCTGTASTATVTLAAPPTVTATATPNPVCLGGTLNLTATAIVGATYAWTGPNAYSSSSPNPVITNVSDLNAGVYTAMVTFNGCTGTANTTSVTVNTTLPPTPVPTFTPASPICEGQTLNLTTGSGGGGATYAWTGPNGFTATTRGATRSNLGLSDGGIYTIVVTRNGCTAMGTTSALVVAPRPAKPIINVTPAPICDGSTLNISATSVPGATYTWTGPNSFAPAQTVVPTVTRPTISAADQGSYSVTVTVNGCTSEIGISIPLIVNPIPATPTATASHTTICTGQTLTLTASDVPGAISYSWSGPATFSINGKTVTRAITTTNHAGAYTVAAIDANGCVSMVGTVTVGVDAAITGVPQIAAVTVCEDSPATFMVTAPVPAATAYAWAKPVGATSTLNNETTQTADITAAALADAGVYTVTITRGVCTLNRTVALTVNARPAPFNVISTPVDAGGVVTVCEGQNVTFGGPAAPALDAYTYLWSGSRGTRTTRNYALTGANSAKITDSGYNFDLVVTNSKGCSRPSSNSLQLLVNPIPATPAPVVSSTSICTGDMLTLMANVVADSYNWTGPNGWSSNMENPSFVITSTDQAGFYSLQVTTLGCSSAIGTGTQVKVRVSPDAPAVYPNTAMTLCAGETLALSTPVVGVTYSWMVPGVSPDFTIQNPIIPGVVSANNGVATLTITAPNGCIATASTAAITIATPISAAINASPAAVLCSGENLELTAPMYPGATYTWKGPGFYYLSGVDQNTAMISGVMAANSGVYTLQIEQAGCIATGSISVVVKPSPAVPVVSVTPNSVCPGETITLSTSATGVSYAWSGPQMPSPTNTATTNVYGVTTAGAYSLMVTADNGCSATAVTEPVTVRTRPTVVVQQSPSVSICAGQTLNLDAIATPTTGVTYAWTGPNGWMASGASVSRNNIQAVQAGVYAVVATLAGCTSSPDAVTVLVNPAPLAPVVSAMPNPFCIGSPVYFSTTVVDAAIYEWTSPNGFSSASNVPNPFISAATGSTAGNYTLKVTVNGCESPITTYSLTAVNISVPTMLSTRNATTNSLTAVWQAAAGISQYTLEYRVVGAGSWTAIGPFVANTDANPANRFRTVSGLQPGTNYQFRVKSVLGNCKSDNSNMITGTTLTLASTCRIPTGLFANVNSTTQATINWTPAPGGQCSILAVGVTGTNPALWPNITIPAPTGSYVVSDLISGTSYSYRLRTNCTPGCPAVSSILSSWTIIQTFNTPSSDARIGETNNLTLDETTPTVSVYPNPNKGAFTLKLENFNTETVPVQILDMTGRVILSQNISGNELNIDLTDQARGIYLVKVANKSAKVVIE